jgi:MauM/NapG family ferredoxin protein
MPEPAMTRSCWKRLRQASQIICLFIFLALFRLTDYTGSDDIPWAVNLFFRMDPLVGLSVTLATREVMVLLWPCLVILGLTLILGRFFCGWICPLGTLIDGAGTLVNPKFSPMDTRRFRFLKYAILILVVSAAFFGVQVLGFFDPFALLVRGLTFSLDPLFNLGVSFVFDGIYLSGPAWLSGITEPVYTVLKDSILPYKQSFFRLASLSFFILAGIFCLELAGKRFWCRHLCPLGALLGLCSKTAILKRLPAKACSHCSLCTTECAMAPFDDQDRFMAEECHMCMDCTAYCPDAVARFRIRRPRRPKPVDISRRQVVASAALGLTLPMLSKVSSASAWHRLIRPPGALDEKDFLATCVRCGECMKVCITQGLQPLGLEAGFEAMFTPVLVPRTGYCEFNCTLCASVCPTHAIAPLPKNEKQGVVMGRAWFDRNRCLPWAEKKGCIVCEEHCPVHDKAIKFDTVRVTDRRGRDIALKQPYVVADRCTGCGICEHVCPVSGPAAIRVFGRDTQRKKEMGMSGGYG